MTKIEYKPHCAKCGTLINAEVTYGKIIHRNRNLMLRLLDDIEINPRRCNNCGEIFDGITIRPPKEVEGVEIE